MHFRIANVRHVVENYLWILFKYQCIKEDEYLKVYLKIQ